MMEIIVGILLTILMLAAVYEVINIIWWITSYGEDSFTKHIGFCFKNSRDKKRAEAERKG